MNGWWIVIVIFLVLWPVWVAGLILWADKRPD